MILVRCEVKLGFPQWIEESPEDMHSFNYESLPINHIQSLSNFSTFSLSLFQTGCTAKSVHYIHRHNVAFTICTMRLANSLFSFLSRVAKMFQPCRFSVSPPPQLMGTSLVERRVSGRGEYGNYCHCVVSSLAYTAQSSYLLNV